MCPGLRPSTAFGHRHMQLDVDWYESVISKEAVGNSGWDILNVKNITENHRRAQTLRCPARFPTSLVFGHDMGQSVIMCVGITRTDLLGRAALSGAVTDTGLGLGNTRL